MTDIDPAAWDWLARPQESKIRRKSNKIKSKINRTQNWVSDQLTKRFGFGPLAKRIIRNVGFNSTSNLIARLGGLLFTLMIARLLKPEGYGLYVIVFSVISLLVPVSDLGLSRGIIYFVSKSLGKNNKARARGYIRYIAPIRLALTTSLAILLLILAEPIAVGFFKKEALTNLIRLGAALLFTQSLIVFLEGLLESVQSFKYVTIGRAINQLCKLLAVAATLYAGYLVGGVIAGMIVAATITILFLTVFIYKNHSFLITGIKEKIDRKKVFRYVKWLSIITASAVIYARIDSIMLGKMLAPEYAAYYGVAHAIIFTIYGILAAGKAMFPVLTQLHGEALKRATKKAVKYILIISVIATVAVLVLIKPAILILYGADYTAAIAVTYVLTPLIIVASLSGLVGNLLLAQGKTKTEAGIFTFGISLNIVLNYFLIPPLAAVGAALTTLISRSSTLALRVIFSRKILANRA